MDVSPDGRQSVPPMDIRNIRASQASVTVRYRPFRVKNLVFFTLTTKSLPARDFHHASPLAAAHQSPLSICLNKYTLFSKLFSST
uniref:SFRICE_009535 n=1 Tax=Spodoptera frugiperda TaxID=7108 RepID=A0A2H1W5R9_SPOFR